MSATETLERMLRAINSHDIVAMVGCPRLPLRNLATSVPQLCLAHSRFQIWLEGRRTMRTQVAIIGGGPAGLLL
jgi:hypothetical protein